MGNAPNPKTFQNVSCRTVSFVNRIGWAKGTMVSSRKTLNGTRLYFYKNVQLNTGIPRHCPRGFCWALLGIGFGAPKDGDEKIQLPLQGECLMHTLYHSPAQV